MIYKDDIHSFKRVYAFGIVSSHCHHFIMDHTSFSRGEKPTKKSLEILEERLSKGEITKAEFEEARRKQIK